MLKHEKSQYLNSILQINLTKYEKKVMIQNCLLHTDLQVWTVKFLHKIYIFFLIWQNTIENPKFNFLTTTYEIRKKYKFAKLFVSIRSTNINTILFKNSII